MSDSISFLVEHGLPLEEIIKSSSAPRAITPSSLVAAFYKQRAGRIRPTQRNPSKLKTENGGISHIGMTKPPTEAPFFLFGGLIQPILYKERANELQVSSQIHRLCVCASGSLMIVTFNC